MTFLSRTSSQTLVGLLIASLCNQQEALAEKEVSVAKVLDAAFKNAKQIEDNETRILALIAVAKTQQQASLFDDSRQTLHETLPLVIEKSSQKDADLESIGKVYMLLDNVEKSMRVINLIEGSHNRVRAFANTAENLAKNGRTATRILQIIDQVKSEHAKIAMIQYAGAGLARDRRVSEAWKMVRLLESKDREALYSAFSTMPHPKGIVMQSSGKSIINGVIEAIAIREFEAEHFDKVIQAVEEMIKNNSIDYPSYAIDSGFCLGMQASVLACKGYPHLAVLIVDQIAPGSFERKEAIKRIVASSQFQNLLDDKLPGLMIGLAKDISYVPRRCEALADIASGLSKSGQKSRSSELFNTAVELAFTIEKKSRPYLTIVYIAKLQNESGHIEDARETLLNASLKLTDKTSLYQIGKAQVKMGNIDRAIESNEVFQTTTEKNWIYSAISKHYAEIGDYNKALETLTKIPAANTAIEEIALIRGKHRDMDGAFNWIVNSDCPPYLMAWALINLAKGKLSKGSGTGSPLP